MDRRLIGLLLGTEDDWPRAFELLLGRLGRIRWRGETVELASQRIVNEPFDLRSKPRYECVIDRLAWWYALPREWLKKIALMDDVYLLNNPFTFQSMEKHSAYCAMIRLGLKVPDTWMVPHKVPPGNERFLATAERYNAPFDLADIGTAIGYPLYMKPFDGGQWVGVTRVRDEADLHAQYDASGERLMHLQSAVEPFDVFVRSLSIGAGDDVDDLRPRQAAARPLPGAARLPRRADRLRGGDDLPPRQRLLPLGVQLVRDDRPRRRGASDRLRERVARTSP